AELSNRSTPSALICDNFAGEHPHRSKGIDMLKVLLPVDGSPSAVRATQKLIDTLDWYKEPPAIELLAVHLAVPKVPNLGALVSKETVQKYYDDECAAMLAPSRTLLDAAGVGYAAHQVIGPIAESIVQHATQSGTDVIFMGTRGMSALANMALGSVTTRVLHLCHIPVVLIH
ncbi:MAG: universal stress protein, partial [Betaproteobacteria bacterium]